MQNASISLTAKDWLNGMPMTRKGAISASTLICRLSP
jgi:hypothetical protein